MSPLELDRYQFLPSGQPAPRFNLTAVKTGRRVSLHDCRGGVLGLVFHSRETVQAVIDIQTTVRPSYPDASILTLASVVDLSMVPRLLQRMAKPILEQAVNQAYQQVPDGYDPADYVFLLPDWQGRVSRSFQVRGADQVAALVVIDAQGLVVGSYQGPLPGPAMLALVQRALGEGSP
jgi:hypothetical protein